MWSAAGKHLPENVGDKPARILIGFNTGIYASIDLTQWIFEEFRITIAKQTLSRELRAMGYRKLSARPRHYAQATGAIEDFKKAFPRAWRQSHARRRSTATR